MKNLLFYPKVLYLKQKIKTHIRISLPTKNLTLTSGFISEKMKKNQLAHSSTNKTIQVFVVDAPKPSLASHSFTTATVETNRWNDQQLDLNAKMLPFFTRLQFLALIQSHLSQPVKNPTSSIFFHQTLESTQFRP